MSFQASSEYFKALVESMEDLVYVCGPNFVVEYMNPAIEEYLGRSAVGEHCHKAFFGSPVPCAWCRHSDVIMVGRSVRQEITCPNDGRRYSVVCTPVKLPDRVVSLNILRDITELRKAQRRLDEDAARLLLGTSAPRTEDVAEAGPSTREVDNGPVKGTVMVVDDEPLLRELLADMLSNLGYQTILIDSGEAALEFYGKHAGEIDAVILDVIMTGMSGLETFKQLQEMDPGVKVLMASGYVEKARLRQMEAMGVKGILTKPFSVSELSNKLGKILAQP